MRRLLMFLLLCALATASAQRHAGDWKVVTEFDPITDENVSYIETARYSRVIYGDLVGTVLGVRCSRGPYSQHGVEVYVDTKMLLRSGARFQVVYRVDRRAPRNVTWRATNGVDDRGPVYTIFATSQDVEGTLHEIAQGSSVIFRLVGTTDGDITLDHIPVAGLQEALARLDCYRGSVRPPPLPPPPTSAPSPPDTLPLAQQAFADADDELNRVYQEARAVLAEDAFEQLRSDQRAWLTTRDQRATDSAKNNVATAPDAPVEEWPEFWRARAGITEERVRFINGWVSHHTGRWESANQWEGVWEDSYGGLMKIAIDQGGNLVVACEVVRGPSASTGELNGVAPTGVSETAFTVPVPYTDEDVDVRLRLVGPVLEVGTNGPAYMLGGINTYFEGSYVRTRLLTEEEWLELVRGTDH